MSLSDDAARRLRERIAHDPDYQAIQSDPVAPEST